jgi:hypothetical protein
MNLTAAGLLATALSFWLVLTAAVWYVVPWMKRQPVAVALSLPLWLHAFRYVALQIFSAQRFGFDVPDGLAHEIAWGDVLGATLALVGLWLLRYRSRAALPVVLLFAVETGIDLLNALVMGIRAHALETAHAVTWLILNLYVPVLWVSFGLLVWQLVSRRSEDLAGRATPLGQPASVGTPLA